MSAAFAPGPWEVYCGGSGYPVAVHTALDGDVDGDTGQHVIVGGNPVAIISDTEHCEANANLIAAAPELYGACEAFVKAGNMSAFSAQANAALAKAHDEAIAALAKARGEA